MPDDFDHFVDDLLAEGETPPTQPTAREPERLKSVDAIWLVTTATFPGREIVATKGIVTGYCAVGVSGLRSFKAAVSDVLGTRSTAIEERMRAIGSECLRQLRVAAAKKECDAVVGAMLKIGELSGEADLLYGHATGTAVRFADAASTASQSPLHRELP